MSNVSIYAQRYLKNQSIVYADFIAGGITGNKNQCKLK